MPSKRSHGEGTLRHRSDGRWELRMMDGYQKDGSPRFKTFYGKTQKEVKLKLKEYQDALISGVQLDTILYFEDWADTWFEGHRDNIAPTTQESYKYCLKMLKEGFYHRPLTVIRPIDIENFLKGMRRDGRSDSYISKARGMLYQIFQKAEANDLVRRNPVRLAEKMRASGTAKRKEAFTTAEVAHLMKVLPDDRMGLSIRLLLGTGMRMQELLALEPQFIEEDGSVIHIRQAVKVVKGTVSIGSPKSKDSIRDIPVPLNVRPCAIKLRDTTDQFIWESPKTGLPCNPTHFRDVFRKSLEERNRRSRSRGRNSPNNKDCSRRCLRVVNRSERYVRCMSRLRSRLHNLGCRFADYRACRTRCSYSYVRDDCSRRRSTYRCHDRWPNYLIGTYYYLRFH